MAIWKNKPIESLKDDELKEAFLSVKQMNENYNTVTQSAEYKKKFKNRPMPEINPEFTDLLNSVNEEFVKRKLTI